MRECYNCGKSKDEVEFYKRTRSIDGLDNSCKECSKVRVRTSQQKLRRFCLEHYGGQCVCCGIDNYEFLCIDHINGGGHQHRKEVGYGSTFCRWLIKRNMPEEYRVLCHNCNQSIGYYGYCPHGNLPEHKGGK
jgi:hypothetical protein